MYEYIPRNIHRPRAGVLAECSPQWGVALVGNYLRLSRMHANFPGRAARLLIVPGSHYTRRERQQGADFNNISREFASPAPSSMNLSSQTGFQGRIVLRYVVSRTLHSGAVNF